MTKQDVPAGEQRLTFDFTLPAPPEKVWRALTIPAFIDRWLLPLDEAGAAGFSGRPQRGTSIAAQVIDAEPPRRLSWHWQEAGEPDGTVTFTLTPDSEGGTLLRLVHVRQAHRAVRPTAANSNGPTMMLAA